MTHYLSVAIFAHEADTTSEAIEELMAPYQETYNEETEDVTGYWDWYQVGGRWTQTCGEVDILSVLDVVTACSNGAVWPHTIFTPDGAWSKEDLNPYPDECSPAKLDEWRERQKKVNEVEWPVRCRQLLTTLATLDAVAVLVDYHC